MSKETPNAADVGQVKKAGDREKEARRLEVEDLLAVMATGPGRRFVWRVLGKTRLFETPYHPSGSTVYHNVGRGDVGRELLADIMDVTPDGYLLMQKEAFDVLKQAKTA